MMLNPFDLTAIQMFLLMMFGHFLADYPLQGDFLSKAKNKYNPIPGVPWWQAMMGHSAIHGGFVGIVTGSWVFGLSEAWAHFWVDTGKCSGKYGYNEDQALHMLIKLFFVAALVISGDVRWI